MKNLGGAPARSDVLVECSGARAVNSSTGPAPPACSWAAPVGPFRLAHSCRPKYAGPVAATMQPCFGPGGGGGQGSCRYSADSRPRVPIEPGHLLISLRVNGWLSNSFGQMNGKWMVELRALHELPGKNV